LTLRDLARHSVSVARVLRGRRECALS
jgi:hypothetical protein